MNGLKVENEKLRGLLHDTVRYIDDDTTTYGMMARLAIRIKAILAEPCEFHDSDQAACQQYSGQVPCEPAPAQDEREAFKRALHGQKVFKLSSATMSAAEWAWFARPAQTEQQPEQEPFWYAVVSEQAPTINSAIKRLDVAQEFADSKRERWPDTRVVPLYTAPQPEQSGLVDALTQLLCWAEKQVCTHEETHRGGAIWEICDSCGAKWADDEGGRPAFVWPKAISNASAALSAQGESHE